VNDGAAPTSISGRKTITETSDSSRSEAESRRIRARRIRLMAHLEIKIGISNRRLPDFETMQRWDDSTRISSGNR
jgi:hypothetical protein